MACGPVEERDRRQPGLSRNTVRSYLAAAEAAALVPGGPAVSQEEWARLARGWFPELADARLRQVTWPAIEEHRDYIVAQLGAGVTMATIHQRLADERGLAASVASLRRYVAANLPEEAHRSQVTVLRLVSAEPGAEAQIDYGRLGRWLDPRTGRRHVVNAFAMVQVGAQSAGRRHREPHRRADRPRQPRRGRGRVQPGRQGAGDRRP